MAPRAVSPARSETEFDIAASLFGQPDDFRERSNGIGGKDVGRSKHGVIDVNGLDVLGAEADDTDDDETAIAKSLFVSNRKGLNLKGRTVKKGGGFQAMGLNANLLKAISRKGFSVPTPIQRKTIPLLLDEKDVVGMARTGSGKTAAFVIPMIEKLKVHSQQVGTRALILSPSRELALQTMQVVRELGRGTDLKSILLVGGDSLEEQFSAMSNNPDVVIATPGRFLHLQVEMNLDLSSVRYVVFDEADRLFEMGFAAQLAEILHALPAARQTLLFSATLPKSLVEFARAGLQDPILVRLDADSKISPDLQSAFFTVKSAEKEGALLHILQDVIHVPTSSQLGSFTEQESSIKKGIKRKRSGAEGGSTPASNPYSTIVFAATKHHVDYLAHLLRLAGYAVSHVYGSLDQTARKMQVQAFRNGQTNILVVTDVAARGIDIPVLANVINYDFPSQPKIYIHRVGRTARAGQKGWSYSIINDADAPYLLDLQLFLGRKLTLGRASTAGVDFAQEVVVGSLQRDNMEASSEWVGVNLEGDADLAALRSVATKGGKLYQRTRNSASAESAKRSKSLVSSNGWTELHPLFNNESSNMELEREKMLARVSGFRPQESIFEIGARRGGRKGNEEAIDAMRSIRHSLESKKQKSTNRTSLQASNGNTTTENEVVDAEEGEENVIDDVGLSEASDSELEVTFTGNHGVHSLSQGKAKKLKRAMLNPEAFRDTENFMSYLPSGANAAEDRAYGVHSGTNSNNAGQQSNFVEAARGATMDLTGDESTNKSFGEARSVMRWDKRHKKYVSRTNDEDGSKGGNPGKRLVRGESGAKIAASFRSGRYDAWKKANRIARAPRVGEAEVSRGASAVNSRDDGPGQQRFKHKSTRAPKLPDKYRDDYEKQKKKFDARREQQTDPGHGQQQDDKSKAGRGGGDTTSASNNANDRKTKRGNSNNGRAIKSDLKSIDDIRKARNLKQKRKEKNARPSRKSVKR